MLFAKASLSNKAPFIPLLGTCGPPGSTKLEARAGWIEGKL